jgi:hypothetical protein
MTDRSNSSQNPSKTQRSESAGLDGTSSNFKLFFPSASPPDIIRASQKDQFYIKFLSEQCFDVVTKIIGRFLSFC